MNKIIKEDSSSDWQHFFDLITKHPDTKFNFSPPSNEFPEFYGDQKYEVILYSGHREVTIVDDSKEDKLSWRKENGYNVVDGQVVAWRVIDESEEEKKIPEDPFLFLDSLQQQAIKTTQHVKELAAEAKMDVRLFKMSGETLLFREEFPEIKGCRFHNVVPTPHYLISGLEITAKPWHNNAFDKDVCCVIDVRIKLLIQRDRSADRVTFDNDPQAFWNCNLGSFEMMEGKYKNEEFGVIVQKEIYCDDSEMLIEDISEFIVLKEVLRRGYAAIAWSFPEPKKML